MLLVFRERTSWIILTAIAMAILGVARLSIDEGEIRLSAWGVFIRIAFCIGLCTLYFYRKQVEGKGDDRP